MDQRDQSSIETEIAALRARSEQLRAQSEELQKRSESLAKKLASADGATGPRSVEKA
jgi:hypothetical protein